MRMIRYINDWKPSATIVTLVKKTVLLKLCYMGGVLKKAHVYAEDVT